MMRRHKPTPADSGDRTVAAGAVIGGYRVGRVRAGDERYTLADATTTDGRSVVLKVFPRAATQDDELRRQVLTLGRVREGIDAPLLPVLSAGEDHGVLYIAHSVPHGETLRQVLADGPLDVPTTMTYLGQVAGALEAATLLGLPHGTLTPDNILITTNRPRQAYLLDFGLRPAQRKACRDATAIEGADYRAPEAIRGAPSESATSVYALACILVECLTGAPPFVYDRPLLTFQAHLVEPPPRVSDRRNGLSAALDDVVTTGLNKHPGQRHASPLRFMRAAQRALGSKAPVPVPAAARRYVDAAAAAEAAAAAAARRQAQAPKPVKPPRPPARPERARPEPARGRADRSGHKRTPARKRTRLWTAPVALGFGLALLASTAGFAAGHLSGTSTAAPQAAAPRVPTAVTQRAAYVHSVDLAMRKLSAERATARRELRRARRPGTQAAQATQLADAYGAARKALAGARGSVSPEPLSDQLAAAQRAYRKLAAAARAHNARAFKAASSQVVVRERELQNALERLQNA
jgi:serine/threonine-protein kinase